MGTRYNVGWLGRGRDPAPHLLLFKILKAQMGRGPKAWQACDNRINGKPKAFRTKPKAPRRVAGMVQVNKRKTESFPTKTERLQARGRRGPGEESRHQKLAQQNMKTFRCVAGVFQVNKQKTESCPNNASNLAGAWQARSRQQKTQNAQTMPDTAREKRNAQTRAKHRKGKQLPPQAKEKQW